MRVPLKQFLQSVTYAKIDRKTKGIVKLFLCHACPSCPFSQLKKIKDASRIDINLMSGNLSVWSLEYDPLRPDLIIKNAISKSPDFV